MRKIMNLSSLVGLMLFVSFSVSLMLSTVNDVRADTPSRDLKAFSRMPVTTPTPGEFPIVASTVCNDLSGPRPGELDGVKECGFNVCMDFFANEERFEKLLKYMDGTGLKLLLQAQCFRYDERDKDERWRKKLPEFINKFKDNPQVAGWKFSDEPLWEQLADLKKRYDLLLATDSTHFTYINLVGEISKPHTGPCSSLGEYLDALQNVFNMDVWSSDSYPIWIRNGQLMVLYEVFYTDLATFAKKAKETGIPMWAYCESMALTTRHHDLPAATEPYLTFEAFSALGYGAQGIVYWTYWQRSSSPTETYTSALVDLDGNKTPAWYAAQSVNRQISALTPVFLGAEMVEVRHTGNIQLKDVRALIEDFGPLSRLTNGDKGVLASHLRNDGKDYLLIVNHDVQNRQKVRLSFKKNANVTKITASSSGTVARKNVGKVRNETLSPGGYALYEWQ